MRELVLLLVLVMPVFTTVSNEKLHQGDLIFQESESAQSRAIQLATKSRYSHMGMLVYQDKQWFVYEAVEPVKLTRLQDWTKRGRKQHYVVKRLKDESKLSPDVLRRMQEIGRRYQGKHYDLTFDWSDSRMYCSELVWKIYREGAGVEIGALQKLRDFDLSSKVVQRKLRERYGNHVPLDEPVISPQAMFESPLLKEVTRRN